MSVSCECCVLSGRGLCVGLITRLEESYRVWCVSECDREDSIMMRPCPIRGFCATGGRGDSLEKKTTFTILGSRTMFRPFSRS
jgi:hypothetical protein